MAYSHRQALASRFIFSIFRALILLSSSVVPFARAGKGVRARLPLNDGARPPLLFEKQ